MIYEEKIELINRINNHTLDADYALLNKFVTDRDPLIRSEIARTLADSDAFYGESLLITLLRDRNMMVRVEAADSLASYRSMNVFNNLMDVIQEESYYLLKGYAITSLAQIGVDILPVQTKSLLIDVLQADRRYFIRLSCYEGLYRLGVNDTLWDIFKLYKSQDYRIRCAVVSTLNELVDDTNRMDICNFVSRQIPKEKAFAVLDNLNHLLALIG